MPSYTVLEGQARRSAFKSHLRKQLGTKKKKKRRKRKPKKKDAFQTWLENPDKPTEHITKEPETMTYIKIEEIKPESTERKSNLEAFGMIKRKRAKGKKSRRQRIVDNFESPKPKQKRKRRRLTKTVVTVHTLDKNHVHIFKEISRENDKVTEQCSCGFHRIVEEM